MMNKGKISNEAIETIGYAYGVLAKASGKTKDEVDIEWVKYPLRCISKIVITAYASELLTDEVYSAVINAGSLLEDEDTNLAISEDRESFWWAGYNAAIAKS